MARNKSRLFRAAVMGIGVAAFGAHIVGQARPDGHARATPWGEPDLQGIWTRDADIPLQRPAKYKDKESFSDAEVADLERRIAGAVGRDSTEARRPRGTERDVNAEYNMAVWTSHLRVGKRTSLIVDPADGRMPPLTPEAQQAGARLREFQIALLQPTSACRDKRPSCAGGTYGPVSPRRGETPPEYLVATISRLDNSEDRNLGERCLGSWLPFFGNVYGGTYRIVQAPGQISMFMQGAFGLGWQRSIPVTTAPHLPADVRQWFGDSRGHWDGNTLVVDVTNFSEKSDFLGSHENLHLVERWTRTEADALEYVVQIDDPTRWTKPWTVKQEFRKESDEANRIYELACHEGNGVGFAAMLRGARIAETAFAEGRGPDPATWCVAAPNPTGCGGFNNGGFADDGEDADPLQ